VELIAKLTALTGPTRTAAAVAAQPLTQVVKVPLAATKPAYTGSTSDYAAELSDRRLEEWHIRETGHSYADLARL
jgi:hypothetical protein